MARRVVITGEPSPELTRSLVAAGLEVQPVPALLPNEQASSPPVVFAAADDGSAPSPDERGQAPFGVLVPAGRAHDVYRWLSAGAQEASTDPLELALRLAARLQATGPEMAASSPARECRAFAPPRVLVVEDDPDVRDLVGLVLQTRFAPLFASDGLEGLRLALREQPDVVLTDLMLPKMDGFALLRALAHDPRTADIPVIILSTYDDEPVKMRGLSLGAVDFLAKPFSPQELVSRVERSMVTLRKRVAQRDTARTDDSTGLPNHRAFLVRLDEELRRSRRYRTALGCMMVALDHFKAINDHLGREAGNRALAAFACSFRGCLRQTDYAARYPGDQLVALLPHACETEAVAAAERIRAQLATTVADENGERLPLRASFGVSSTSAGETGAAQLLHQADTALRAAQTAGQALVTRASVRPDSAARAG